MRACVVVTLLGLTSAASASPAAAELTLNAADGTKVFGTLTSSEAQTAGVILLFHQAGSNRHEYDPMVPKLLALGFDVLAIDQRSGGKKWGHDNATVKARGGSTKYLAALPDLQATLDWANAKYGTAVVAVGSSYSAALVFVLAQANPGKLRAVASFSPGEYLGKKGMVTNAVAAATCPIYITASSSAAEQGRVDTVLSKVDKSRITRYRPVSAVHGASSMRADKNGEAAEANWSSFVRFLESVSGSAATPEE